MEGTATSTTIQNAGKVMVILPKSILQIDTKSISYKLSLFNTSFPWMGLPHIQITSVLKMASSPLLKSMKEGSNKLALLNLGRLVRHRKLLHLD